MREGVLGGSFQSEPGKMLRAECLKFFNQTTVENSQKSLIHQDKGQDQRSDDMHMVKRESIIPTSMTCNY